MCYFFKYDFIVDSALYTYNEDENIKKLSYTC